MHYNSLVDELASTFARDALPIYRAANHKVGQAHHLPDNIPDYETLYSMACHGIITAIHEQKQSLEPQSYCCGGVLVETERRLPNPNVIDVSIHYTHYLANGSYDTTD